jgi:hypothetical protein
MAPTPVEIVPALLRCEICSAFTEHCGYRAGLCRSTLVYHTGMFLSDRFRSILDLLQRFAVSLFRRLGFLTGFGIRCSSFGLLVQVKVLVTQLYISSEMLVISRFVYQFELTLCPQF